MSIYSAKAAGYDREMAYREREEQRREKQNARLSAIEQASSAEREARQGLVGTSGPVSKGQGFLLGQEEQQAQSQREPNPVGMEQAAKQFKGQVQPQSPYAGMANDEALASWIRSSGLAPDAQRVKKLEDGSIIVQDSNGREGILPGDMVARAWQANPPSASPKTYKDQFQAAKFKAQQERQAKLDAERKERMDKLDASKLSATEQKGIAFAYKQQQDAQKRLDMMRKSSDKYTPEELAEAEAQADSIGRHFDELTAGKAGVLGRKDFTPEETAVLREKALEAIGERPSDAWSWTTAANKAEHKKAQEVWDAKKAKIDSEYPEGGGVSQKAPGQVAVDAIGGQAQAAPKGIDLYYGSFDALRQAVGSKQMSLSDASKKITQFDKAWSAVGDGGPSPHRQWMDQYAKVIEQNPKNFPADDVAFAKEWRKPKKQLESAKTQAVSKGETKTATASDVKTVMADKGYKANQTHEIEVELAKRGMILPPDEPEWGRDTDEPALPPEDSMRPTGERESFTESYLKQKGIWPSPSEPRKSADWSTSMFNQARKANQ